MKFFVKLSFKKAEGRSRAEAAPPLGVCLLWSNQNLFRGLTFHPNALCDSAAPQSSKFKVLFDSFSSKKKN
jgi:hypothetical protein